ncbi:MAG: molybdenum cofactor biosysynthesis protein [Verrucomicrobia bacterium]|nr:MAG: molybdenum cofactor biosysynthesis protein [Verrucomicrobiota bacterium]
MLIRQIFISPGHNFVGHHGRPPGDFPLVEVPNVECVAGQGLRGDRYFDFRENYKGQITFLSTEVFEKLCTNFGIKDKPAGVLRRNIIVSGIDVLSLIGQTFEIQGVRFLGTQHCAPCEWMNVAIAPGAKEFLKENAGLRAQILSDGKLTLGDARLRILSEPLQT